MDKIILTTIDKEEIKQLVSDAIQSAIGKQDKDQPEFLDVNEACKFLGIAKSTLYTKCSKQIIPHFKQGKKLYFHKDELAAWLRSGKRKTISDIRAEVQSNLGKQGDLFLKKK
jgi:excisionase family DNA binding protein